MTTCLVLLRRDVGIAILVALAAAPAAACPIEPYDPDRIAAAIEKASSCKAAYDLMISCRRNTGGDVELANAVTTRCERTFLTRGASARTKAYAEERAACAMKYAKRQGTMYASFQATCEAGVAVKYAR